ncbi:hypothetical protein N7463_000360 [Penicillium fimorum]|uniref:Uncharacterized protein n=1 Tax=Penicillium fimorum TaxID=1882269 RepID=A0A9W9Y5S2_9EURO|nr:hypothetical protein N7463_000360 [Penicillium fimorum]
MINPRQRCGWMRWLWPEAKRFRPIKFASCHRKLGDVETYATDFGLWIAEHRSTELPDPSE